MTMASSTGNGRRRYGAVTGNGSRRRYGGVAALLVVLSSWGNGAVHSAPGDEVFHLDNGLVLPYPLDNPFRGWVECTGRGHHKAFDIGGVGPAGGLGTVVRALGKARVVQIGMPADDPERFGTPLTGVATVMRSGTELPAWKDVPGYGKVWFFTKDYGRHRSGGTIALKLLDGPLVGHEVHYLHVAAARRGLAVGDEVEAGDELGLLGGTAVLDAPPHLHLSIETPEGRSLDVGPIFGIGQTRVPCRADAKLMGAIRSRYTKAAHLLMAALRADRARNVVAPKAITGCGPTVIAGDFEDGKLLSQRFVVEPLADGTLAPFTLKLERSEDQLKARWAPRIQVEDQRGNALFTGTLAQPAARRRFGFESLGSGKRGVASVMVTPKKNEVIAVKVMAWPVNKRLLRGARWILTIDRACP